MAGVDAQAMDVGRPVALGDSRGLLLMGGTDVNPKLYGAAAEHETDEPDDERDRAEWQLLSEALEKDLPVLAICRGLQLLNVHQGGDLIQHLGSKRHDAETEDKGLAAHPVTIAPGSLLGEIAGVNQWQANSRHHQAVKRLGRNLEVTGRDPADNTIEAIESKDHRFVLGVQWHPEDQLVPYPEQLRLFLRFGEAL